MAIRGVRGAIPVKENTTEAILDATRILLNEVIQENGLDMSEIASAFFTLTPDLNACFPAVAARELGWTNVPLLCAQEIAVPDAMRGLLRVLVHWNTNKQPNEIQHVYIGEAGNLRPDLAKRS